MKLSLGIKSNTDHMRENMKFPLFELRRMIRRCDRLLAIRPRVVQLCNHTRGKQIGLPLLRGRPILLSLV